MKNNEGADRFMAPGNTHDPKDTYDRWRSRPSQHAAKHLCSHSQTQVKGKASLAFELKQARDQL